ncbi:uncharacterized protein V6R79_004740 [Siganus canaliculatus]
MAAAMRRPHGAQDRQPGQRIINCELSRIGRGVVTPHINISVAPHWPQNPKTAATSQLAAASYKKKRTPKDKAFSQCVGPSFTSVLLTVVFAVESVHSRNEQRLRLPDFWDILIGGDRLQSLVPDPCEDAEFSPSTDKVRTPERRAESRFVRTTCCRSTSDEQSSTKAPERHLCFTAEQQTLRAVTIPPSPLRAPTAVLDCPVCDKPALVRLDKHLQDAHYINAEEREPVLKDAKRRAIIKELAALRLTCPTIRMVS